MRWEFQDRTFSMLADTELLALAAGIRRACKVRNEEEPVEARERGGSEHPPPPGIDQRCARSLRDERLPDTACSHVRPLSFPAHRYRGRDAPRESNNNP